MQINACRRYLQAQTLADITSVQGTRLLQNTMIGDPQVIESTIKVSTFNQARPTGKAWKTWRRFLQTISNKYGVLYQPLGVWTADVSQACHWPAYIYDPNDEKLYSHHQGPE
jgi:hypothetical protein